MKSFSGQRQACAQAEKVRAAHVVVVARGELEGRLEAEVGYGARGEVDAQQRHGVGHHLPRVNTVDNRLDLRAGTSRRQREGCGGSISRLPLPSAIRKTSPYKSENFKSACWGLASDPKCECNHLAAWKARAARGRT